MFVEIRKSPFVVESKEPVGYAVQDHFDFLVSLSQLLFRLLALGEIAGHFGETNVCPCFVSNRGEDDIGPKSSPVFAQAPALPFGSVCRCGHRQCFFRLSLGNLFRRIEQGEILA